MVVGVRSSQCRGVGLVVGVVVLCHVCCTCVLSVSVSVSPFPLSLCLLLTNHGINDFKGGRGSERQRRGEERRRRGKGLR